MLYQCTKLNADRPGQSRDPWGTENLQSQLDSNRQTDLCLESPDSWLRDRKVNGSEYWIREACVIPFQSVVE